MKRAFFVPVTFTRRPPWKSSHPLYSTWSYRASRYCKFVGWKSPILLPFLNQSFPYLSYFYVYACFLLCFHTSWIVHKSVQTVVRAPKLKDQPIAYTPILSAGL